MKHYYRVGDEKFLNAIDAWSRIRSNEASGVASGYELVLDEGKLASYDWLTPVLESQRSLEEKFATKIRNENKYVRILYSGGSDSISVADAFLRSGNAPDEYVMYAWDSMTDGCLDSMAMVNMKLGWLKDMHAKYNIPLAKMTVLQVGQAIHEDFFHKNWFLKHPGHAGTESFNVNQLATMSKYAPLPPGVTDYVEVMGMEKPRISADDNEIFFQMNDKNTMYSVNPDSNVVWFYMSADAPELIRTQCQGAIAVARHLFPNLSFRDAIHKLQTDRNFYHEWCLSVGRVATKFQNSFIHMSKNLGQSKDRNTNRYHHIEQYSGVREQTWKHYEEYLMTVKELSGGLDTVYGINTQRFVLEKLCSK